MKIKALNCLSTPLEFLKKKSGWFAGRGTLFPDFSRIFRFLRASKSCLLVEGLVDEPVRPFGYPDFKTCTCAIYPGFPY